MAKQGVSASLGTKNPTSSTPKTQQPQVHFGPFEAMTIASYVFTIHFQEEMVNDNVLVNQQGAAVRHGESASTQKKIRTIGIK